MIDFKGLDKTQIRFVERDCHCPDILNTICINNFNDANRILNKIINNLVDNISDLHPGLKYIFVEDDLLDKIRNTVDYYKFGARSIEEEVYISEFILNNFNTKSNRALLTEIFGDKVHEEDFMTNCKFVIAKIIYAILYV